MVRKKCLVSLVICFALTTPPSSSKDGQSSTIDQLSKLEGIQSPTSNSRNKQSEGQKGAKKGVDLASSRPSRIRRSIMQLAGMLRCTTGCDPLAYKSYGCYCGYLGAGRPVDDIDRCCREHDRCYSATICPQLFLYFFRYPWRCTSPGIPQCGRMPGVTVAQQCARQLCLCDRDFVRCIGRFPCPRQSAICRTNPFGALQSLFIGKR